MRSRTRRFGIEFSHILFSTPNVASSMYGLKPRTLREARSPHPLKAVIRFILMDG